jgi:predicted transcriptional regulator
MTTVPITVRIDAETVDVIDRLAEAQSRPGILVSRASLVRHAVIITFSEQSLSLQPLQNTRIRSRQCLK